MANKKPTKTTLKKGDNLPSRGKGKKSLMLNAIRDVCIDEHEFLKQVVTIGLGDSSKDIFPNPALLTLVLNRIDPPLKSVSPMVEFQFDAKDEPHVQAAQIMQSAANGEIPPDIANTFIQSIKAMIDIEEYTDLKDRIEKLEALVE